MPIIRDLQRECDMQLVQHLSAFTDLRGPDHMQRTDVRRRCNMRRGNNLRRELYVRGQHHVSLRVDVPWVLHLLELTDLCQPAYLCWRGHMRGDGDLFSDEHLHGRGHL